MPVSDLNQKAIENITWPHVNFCGKIKCKKN